MHGRAPLYDWQRRMAEAEVDIVTGCFLLIRRRLWNDLGGFDRLEDLDIGQVSFDLAAVAQLGAGRKKPLNDIRILRGDLGQGVQRRVAAAQVVDGDLVKVMSWYDNEWGYANQMIREAIDIN